MKTAQALIYGSETEEASGDRLPGETERPSDSIVDEGTVELVPEACPCPELDDDPSDGDSEEGTSERHRNGEVWWTSYVEPDKPLADYGTLEIGRQGEVLAARYLTKRGMRVIGQNWRSKMGEVDIVAEDEGGEVALVEVKTRLDLGGDPQSMPELAVDGQKQRRYRQVALVYLMCHPEVVRMRFDIIAVNILDDHNARLRHLVGAFCWDS